MTVFIERTPDGAIKGVYANKQPGYAEEAMPADHPDIAAFMARVAAPPPRDLLAELDALKAQLAALKGGHP
jgi:hypothetical protein